MSELLRGRRFKVWDYCVTFSSLLLRSPEVENDETNVDVTFRGVTFFDGPFALGEIELQEPTEAERARVRLSCESETIWALQGTQGRALVAAGDVWIDQNRHGLMASPFRSPLPGAEPEVPDVVEADIEPVDPRERPALLEELAAITAYPLYNHVVDKASGRIRLRARGDQEFDLRGWFLTREHRIDVRIGPPRVLYREALARPMAIDETHKTMGADGAAFARVLLAFEPKLRGAGASFESRVRGGAVPEACLGGVAEGVWGALAAGPRGWPVVDLSVVLTDGAFHDTDSSPEAFVAAAGAACRRAMDKAGTVLLEPMMRVDVSLKETYVGAVRDDLVARRGRILDQEWSGEWTRLIARVPLVNVLGYGAHLRILTDGYVHHSMRFERWEPVDPPEPTRFRPAAALRLV